MKLLPLLAVLSLAGCSRITVLSADGLRGLGDCAGMNFVDETVDCLAKLCPYGLDAVPETSMVRCKPAPDGGPR